MKNKDEIIWRRVFWVIIGLLFLSWLALSVPIPVNRTVNALEISVDDPSHVVERTVTIQGLWRRNIFSRLPFHEFYGKFEISGYPETEMLAFAPIARRYGRIGHIGPISYYDMLVYSEHWFGISTRFLFRQAVIEIVDWIESEDDYIFIENQLFVVLNATMRDEALEILSIFHP